MTEQLIEELGLAEDSIFLHLGSSGLISFSVLFACQVILTDVDAEEFDQVAHLLRQNTTHGSRHRDTTGNSYKVRTL